MKNLFFILLICCSILTVAIGESFSSDKAYTQKGIARTFSEKKVLSASEVSQLVVGKTMAVLSEKTDKNTGKHEKYKGYVSEMGGFLVAFENGARETRTWSVKADGALCIMRSLGRHSRSTTCGYIVSEGGGVYKMYEAKHVYEKKGRVVGGEHIKQLLTFSNLKNGNTL